MFSWKGYNWKSSMENERIIHPDTPWYWMSEDMVEIDKNGIAKLSIRNNPKYIKYWDGKTYHPTIECGTMRSVESFSFGTFSATIQVPSGTNLWPAFWLTGEGNWPPEIDIMEAWCDEDGDYFRMFIPQFPYIQASWSTTTNVHYNNKNHEHESVGSRNIQYTKQSKNPEKNFIKYECEWLPNKITFKANGKTTRTIDSNVCKMLTENIDNKENGYKMNVIFNVWCENPKTVDVSMETPMAIKDFSYTPL